MQKYHTSGIQDLLGSYAGIMFGTGIWIGGGLLLLTLINPNVGISGFITVLSAYLFSRLLGKSEDFLHLHYYIYNPLLVGLSLGTVFKIGPTSLFFLINMGILTFIITSSMAFFFANSLRLPILSMPFVICSFIAHLAAYRYSGLFVRHLYIAPVFPYQDGLPEVVAGFFTAMGAIYCLPNVVTGIGIFVILFMFSRILAFLAMVGYLTGILSTTVLTDSFSQAVASPNSFNYILIATAVGGVFLIPSIRSYIMAIIAVAVSVPVVEACQIFWERFGIPIFALPFNLITLTTIYAFGVSGAKIMAGYYWGSPEATLDNHITSTSRFPEHIRPISAPFAGTWTVWQSFEGEWTHRGPWKYGLDFIVTDDDGNSFAGNGEFLESYYAFRKPILSPVTGIMISVVDNVPDNSPGEVDEASNWGNYVVIYDSRGFYVLIAHFVRASIGPKVGDKVQAGQVLGLCGNSGYSPQPHIHLQAQLEPNVGAPTIPFSISSWINPEKKWCFNGILPKGQKITGVTMHRPLAESLELLIGTELSFEYTLNGKKQDDVNLWVAMADDATRYLADGNGALYFGYLDNMFCAWRLVAPHNSPLQYIFAAAPRIPFSLESGLWWSDLLPLGLIESCWKRELFRFLAAFDHRMFQVEATYQVVGDNIVAGKICFGRHRISTRLELDAVVGIKQIEFISETKKVFLRRKVNESL